MKTATITDAVSFFYENDRFLLVTHKRPDGDTLGSAGALCLALRRMGKTAYLYRNPQVTEKYLGYVAHLFSSEDFAPKKTVMIDLADVGLFPVGFSGNADFCIDHHPTNSFYATSTFIHPEKSSCGEIVLELIQDLCGSITSEEANLLYMAVSTDTGCFQYANTSAATHTAAAALISAGADIARLNKELFRTFSLSRLKLEGMVFATLRSHMNGKINIAVITLDMMEKAGATEDDCDDLASLPGRVSGNIASAMIREISPTHCKISARSSKEVNVSAICARFGGGGHTMAAGCELDMNPDQAAETFRKLFEEALA